MRPFRYQLGAIALAASLLGGATAPQALAAGHEAGEADSGKANITVISGRTPHDRLFDIEFVGSRGWVVGQFGVILRSDDGGTTWAELAGIEDQDLLGLDFVDEKRGVAVGTMGGAYYTEDGGDTWERAKLEYTGRLFNADIKKNGFGIAVGEFGAILRTDDLGHSWKTITPAYDQVMNQMEEPHLYDVFIDSNDRFMVFGEFNTILRSPDRGNTWEVLRKGNSIATEASDTETMGNESLFSTRFIDDQRGWACGQSGLIITTSDGGDTWTDQISNSESLIMDVWMSSEGEGAAIGMRTLLRTSDYGATWQNRPGPFISERWYQALAMGESVMHIEGEKDNSGEKMTPSMTTVSNPVYAVGVGGLIIRIND